MEGDQDRDRALGMDRPIQRRDFLNGVAVGGAALAMGIAPRSAMAAAQDAQGYYPPTLTGLRGSHPGAFEAAHELRDGRFWTHPKTLDDTDAPYDLIVVGAGISGLAAAHFWRTARPDSRVLVLDNHDDFGGHAKRNEFHQNGRMELMNGGTLEIDSPRPYSRIADGLLKTLGIDPPALARACADEDFYKRQGLTHGIFFDREMFGADHLATGSGSRPWSDVLAHAPLSPAARDSIIRIEAGRADYLPGLSSLQKKDRLSRISYRDYLLQVAKVDPGAILYYQVKTNDEWGVGIDAVSALDCWGFGLPGFQGLGLEPGHAPRMGYTASGYADGESYNFHFPDGNATIARLLVRSLIPTALPGQTVEDAVTARADYGALDQSASPVRLRLSSIVVGARNTGNGVEVAYTKAGRVTRVRAEKCILACYNMMIPYLCPELPAAQKEALHYLVKVPLVYTSVALRNWQAFRTLGVSQVYAPGSFFSRVQLNPKTTISSYTSITTPEDPALVFMIHVPAQPGLDERSQHRAGHMALLETPFSTFERKIRDQLGRMLSPGGFDSARDISAITVNRWPHGYAYEYNPLFDPQWAPGQAPHEIGRKPFGRIAIANSDAGAAAYTDSAIDQADRAVRELLAL